MTHLSLSITPNAAQGGLCLPLSLLLSLCLSPSFPCGSGLYVVVRFRGMCSASLSPELSGLASHSETTTEPTEGKLSLVIAFYLSMSHTQPQHLTHW